MQHTSADHHAHHTHDAHKGHHAEDFLKKFWVVLVLTIPLVLSSGLTEVLFGWSFPEFSWSRYMGLFLGSVVFFYGGAVFLRGARRELAARLPGMMTLIALAITAAYLWSVYATFVEAAALWWELSTLIAVMLLGHWIEMKAIARTKGALQELAKLLPDTAEVVRGETIQTVALSALRAGDTVLVKPGAKVPADGAVLEGASELNESLMTGESKPVMKGRGDEVIAGTINGDGALTVRVTKIGEDTFLAGVARLVAEAEASKSRLQILSDRAALGLTAIAIVSAGVTFTLWILADAGLSFAIERLVAVLVIACPHALGLAVPLVAAISTTKAARNGFLVKRRLALEEARRVDTVLFDKTGTLTAGAFSVTQASSDEALALASAVEAHSEHPIGKAIVAEARERGLAFQEPKNFKRIPGVGAEAEVEGKKVFVGQRGGSSILVEVDGKRAGTLSLSDRVRPEATEAVGALKRTGIRVAMVTGDSEDVAREVAKELGIEEYFARVAPDQKAQKVRLLQKGGRRVAMVGDGVNDAPALAQADLGIAVGAGTNVAIESAGIILLRNDPRDVPKIITLSKLTYAKMLQNLFWATGYNVVALPLAAGALVAKGIVLEPALAAVFMSLSTVIVAVNASLLARRRL